jgi:hypothetical protein
LREPYARLNRVPRLAGEGAGPSHQIYDLMLHLACVVLYIDTSSLQCVAVVLDCSSKEVIRLQVPLQPPCYDFSPLAELRFDSPNKSEPRLNPTRVKRRAVCARSRDVFTAR